MPRAHAAADPEADPAALTWAEAMARGLHAAETGFYSAGRGPGTDFRTATTIAPDLLADALTVLFARLPASVRRQVVEIGAGSGALLGALAARLPAGVDLVGVERRARPRDLPTRVTWTDALPDRLTGLLLAIEWLDTVPVDVVVEDRLLRVRDDGGELSGAPPSTEDSAWLARWWPDGDRREVGHRRDAAWADAVGRLRAGVAIAVDYGHTRGDRPPGGSLTGYRAGRVVAPIPDGDTDVTAAVAWDSLLDAARERCPGLGQAGVLTDQRTALAALGVRSVLPPRPGGSAAGYADGLRRASAARVLTDPAGLGAFGWLMHAVEVPAGVLPVPPGTFPAPTGPRP